MPNDLPLLPPKNQLKHLDKSMISLPSDFRHLAHVGPMGASEIENLRKSDNVIDTVNEVNLYVRPTSSNSTLRSQRKERVGLDDAFPAASQNSDDFEVIRGYENQPTSHQYINVAPPRPSKKNYRAPAPPTPPSQQSKPNLVFDPLEEIHKTADPPVVFRSISKEPNLSDNIPSPKIHTPKRIEAPKPNSVVIERPGELGAFSFGLDDCIPIMKNTSPLKTLSPLHRPLAIPKPPAETPILSPASPPKYQDGNYMSTMRSTSAQGKKILDELDDWLDDLDDDDREQLSTISTDESGYPTLAHERDRAFMKHLVEKYELGVEPETVRLRKKKAPAPRLPPEALSSPTFQAPVLIPAFAARPVSMPPNRPPPSYDAPSFDAPLYEPSGLINGRALTKQNALDLRSSEEGVSPAMARFLNEKKFKSATMPMSIGRTTISSGFTDFSTTSSRSDASSSVLSVVDEDPIEVLKKCEEINEHSPPVPKPRTRKTVSTEPTLVEEEERVVEIKSENVIGEEFEVIETKKETEIDEEDEEKKEDEQEIMKKIEGDNMKEQEMKKEETAIILAPSLPPPPQLDKQYTDTDPDSESDDEGELIVTRF